MRFSDVPDKSPPPPPLRVVLAQDDSDQRFLLATMLRADGYPVNEVNDGHGLLGQLRSLVSTRGQPSPGVLAIRDYRLRDCDALTVLRQLRAEGRLPRFILITGFWSSQVYGLAKDLGALAVFAKPFDFEDLRIVVRYLLQTRATNDV